VADLGLTAAAAIDNFARGSIVYVRMAPDVSKSDSAVMMGECSRESVVASEPRVSGLMFDQSPHLAALGGAGRCVGAAAETPLGR
jgi:hypothetical protein